MDTGLCPMEGWKAGWRDGKRSQLDRAFLAGGAPSLLVGQSATSPLSSFFSPFNHSLSWDVRVGSGFLGPEKGQNAGVCESTALHFQSVG